MESEDSDQGARLRRRVLWSMPAGLYLLSSSSSDTINLMTLSWAMQVATEPKMVAVSVETGSISAQLIRDSGVMGLCLLGKSMRAAVRRFVKPAIYATGPEGETLSGYRIQRSAAGLPIIEGASGFLGLEVVDERELGSHSLFLGLVDQVIEIEPEELIDPTGLLSMSDTRMSYGG